MSGCLTIPDGAVRVFQLKRREFVCLCTCGYPTHTSQEGEPGKAGVVAFDCEDCGASWLKDRDARPHKWRKQ